MGILTLTSNTNSCIIITSYLGVLLGMPWQRTWKRFFRLLLLPIFDSIGSIAYIFFFCHFLVSVDHQKYFDSMGKTKLNIVNANFNALAKKTTRRSSPVHPVIINFFFNIAGSLISSKPYVRVLRLLFELSWGFRWQRAMIWLG